MASLSISLFRSFDVCRNGQPVDMLRLEKEQALLAYLAVEGHNAQRRELLATLLWPEAASVYGRANLRQLLHRLRLAIGDLGEDRSLLQLSPQYIQLASGEAISVDVTTFASLLNSCRTHKHASLASCQDCLAKMRAAIALYRGEFLEDWHLPDSALYQDWVTLKQAELHNMAAATLSFLARWHEQRADYERADAYIQQHLRLEPWSEDAHRQRMSILTANGKRTSALKQFAYCRQLLAEELGVEPSLETKHLYQLIEHDSLRKQPTGDEATYQRTAGLYGAAAAAIVQGRNLEAAGYIEHLMSLAQLYQSPDMIWLAKGLAGVNEFFRGDLQQARSHLGQIIFADASERSRYLRAITGIDFYAACLNWLAWTLHILGDFQQAKEYAAKALVQAEEHPPSQALLKVLAHIAACCLGTGPADAARVVERNGIFLDAIDEGTHPWRDFLYVFGDLSSRRARQFGSTAADVATTLSGNGLVQILQALIHAELCVRDDEASTLLVSISQALALVEETGTSVFTAEFYRLRGLTLFAWPHNNRLHQDSGSR